MSFRHAQFLLLVKGFYEPLPFEFILFYSYLFIFLFFSNPTTFFKALKKHVWQLYYEMQHIQKSYLKKAEFFTLSFISCSRRDRFRPFFVEREKKYFFLGYYNLGQLKMHILFFFKSK